MDFITDEDEKCRSFHRRFHSLASQRVDGIQSGGTAGGHEAEDDANVGRENECDEVDLRIEHKGRTDDLAKAHARP